MKMTKLVLAILFSIAITACGGDGGDGGPGPTPTTQTISGVAAVGNPLSQVPVYLKDKTGKEVNALTNDDGNFSFVTTDLTPPFYLRTQGYGLFTYTDQQSGTANLDPLATAVIAIANGGEADICTNPPTQLDLTTATSTLKDFLSLVLQKYGVQDADFITTPFDANGQGMDAVIDSIHTELDPANKTIEIKNSFTGETIGQGTFNADGQVNETDPIDQDEVNNLPQSMTSKKYFSYTEDNYGSPEFGPIMIDMLDDGNGKLSVAPTATDGDTGDIIISYGQGTKTGDSISFTFHGLIMCNYTDPPGTDDSKAIAEFTGTIDANGNISGTFTNTLPPGDTCKENGGNTYEGAFRADDVTNATPADIAGTYDVYVTPDEWAEEGPATLTITQSGSSIDISAIDPQGVELEFSGHGTVYGNYTIFRIPAILGHDTNQNAIAEYATFFGEFDSETNTIKGVYGDGIPPGDELKAPDYDTTGRTTAAEGFWRAVKK